MIGLEFDVVIFVVDVGVVVVVGFVVEELFELYDCGEEYVELYVLEDEFDYDVDDE